MEELGTYLESETEVKNFQLTKDQIITLTTGIVSTEIIDEKWDGKTYYLKAKIVADPKDVANSIEKLRQDRQKTKELEEVRKTANELLREVERLKRKLGLAKKDQTKSVRYDEAIKELSAKDWFEKGYALVIARKYQEAMGAFTKSIELDPRISMAYSNRSLVYGNLGIYQQALADANKAIELDPRNELAYVNRGLAYFKLGNHQQVLADSNKAIELDPGFSMAYVNRSAAYSTLGNTQQALADANKAIELDPKEAKAFYNRGLTYHHLGDPRQAIRDYDQAIELDPALSMAYVNRSAAYSMLGNTQQALADANKAIELDPRNALAYVNRGLAHGKLGEYQQAIIDYDRAIELNPKLAQAFQNRGFAYEQLGNSESAMGDYKKACELGAKAACEKAISGSRLIEEKSTTRNLRVFKPGDYINYKLTGFVSMGGVDVPVFGTAEYKILNETQIDYYGNECGIIRNSLDFTALGKDQSAKVTMVNDLFITQDLNGSLLIHGHKDHMKGNLALIKIPVKGWYWAFKCPFNARGSLSQKSEFTDGSSQNMTDMVLSEESISVPAGSFNGIKTISNTFSTNANGTKAQSMETNWLVPEIGPVRSNLEHSSDKEFMKFILEMTDTNIPYRSKSVFPEPSKASLPVSTPPIASEREVRQFFESYVNLYNRKEIAAFISLFSPKAIQNQKDGLEKILKTYESFFDQMETVEYRVTINKIETQQNSVEVIAQYELEAVTIKGRKKQTWQGQIRWGLAKETGALKVVTLDYQPESSK